MYAARPAADCKREHFSVFLLNQSFPETLLANFFLFGWKCAQEPQDLSNEGLIVPLDLVEAELCPKADPKRAIHSFGTSIRFILKDGN